MTDLDVTRSLRFVSLDTHPANNALVVTYEILVVVSDLQRGHELTRRTKRDQLQITISALDSLSEVDFKDPSKRAQLNLRKMSEDIIRSCPILHQINESQAYEDIQLHLLYLLNRKQSQLYRPPSATSNRPGSTTPVGYRSRLSSARQGSARARDGRKWSHPNRGDASSSMDIYASLCEKESKLGQSCGSMSSAEWDRLDEFLEKFLSHLIEAEGSSKDADKLHQNQAFDSEVQLEGLYGEPQERLAAIRSIRWQAQDDQRLASVRPNRLLISAILRTLQDSNPRDIAMHESILYCLVRFTQFEDVHERLFNQGEPIDLIRLIVELLEEQVGLATSANDLRSILDKFYQLNSLLMILNNLVNFDLHAKSNKVRKKLIQLQGKRVVNILIGLFVLVSRHLARDVRNQSSQKYERLTLILAELIKLAQNLVLFREFMNLLRVKSQLLSDSLISCVNTLQLSRPGSGSMQQASSKRGDKQTAGQGEQFLVRDQLILCEIYEIEMELLKLINNLIYDSRFRLRFGHKSLLLKCVLRNLVVFLASNRGSNTLSPYDHSSVLMVPFKCLHELCCQDSIKDELFKSKIIIKCLFEYLLSSTADLKILLDSLAPDVRATDLERPSAQEELIVIEDTQISLKPSNASHYILATWINLSAQKSASFYSPEADEQLREPLNDYIDMSTSNLDLLISKILQKTGDQSASRNFLDAQLIVYIHAKLLRNLTQYLSLCPNEAGSYASCAQRFRQSLGYLLAIVGSNSGNQMVMPLAVECVGTMTNLVSCSASFWQLENDLSTRSSPDESSNLSTILNRLCEMSLALALNADGEEDDFLLVSINLVGALAKYREICQELRSSAATLISICNSILETRISDFEMTISCLFAIYQLENHWVFMETISCSLEDGRAEALSLVARLSSLMMHPDLSVSKLANFILNTLKQFEEQQSLSDSITCKSRFSSYNQKWLNAIKVNRDEASANEDDVDSAGLSKVLGSERESEMADDFNQLRTVTGGGGGGDDEEQASSSRSSASSSNRLADGRAHRDPTSADSSKPKNAANQNELDGEPCEDVEDEDDEEETLSEPDLNVIDANSMIKHLTDRREFRSELLMRK